MDYDGAEIVEVDVLKVAACDLHVPKPMERETRLIDQRLTRQDDRVGTLDLSQWRSSTLAVFQDLSMYEADSMTLWTIKMTSYPANQVLSEVKDDASLRARHFVLRRESLYAPDWRAIIWHL